jgi:hypothetical protein
MDNAWQHMHAAARQPVRSIAVFLASWSLQQARAVPSLVHARAAGARRPKAGSCSSGSCPAHQGRVLQQRQVLRAPALLGVQAADGRQGAPVGQVVGPPVGLRRALAQQPQRKPLPGRSTRLARGAHLLLLGWTRSRACRQQHKRSVGKHTRVQHGNASLPHLSAAHAF